MAWVVGVVAWVVVVVVMAWMVVGMLRDATDVAAPAVNFWWWWWRWQ
jgi:hypothetical protein